jgi:hypothetical protein
MAIKLSPRQQQAGESVLDAHAGPFRRSHVSKAIYPLTSPRSLAKADLLADRLLRQLAADGRIQRHGHQHWIKVAQGRRLCSGRIVPELDAPMELRLNTRSPGKWLAVDLETGEAWIGTQSGWKRATDADRAEARTAVGG